MKMSMSVLVEGQSGIVATIVELKLKLNLNIDIDIVNQKNHYRIVNTSV